MEPDTTSHDQLVREHVVNVALSLGRALFNTLHPELAGDAPRDSVKSAWENLAHAICDFAEFTA